MRSKIISCFYTFKLNLKRTFKFQQRTGGQPSEKLLPLSIMEDYAYNFLALTQFFPTVPTFAVRSERLRLSDSKTDTIGTIYSTKQMFLLEIYIYIYIYKEIYILMRAYVLLLPAYAP